MLLNSVVKRVRADGDAIMLELDSDGQEWTLRADALLLAVGRVPNTDLLDVAKTGVAVDDRVVPVCACCSWTPVDSFRMRPSLSAYARQWRPLDGPSLLDTGELLPPVACQQLAGQ
jgi:hypothetical protein